MKITRTDDKDIFEVLFTDKESLLISSMIGNTFSGAPHWIITPNDFEKETGITYEKAVQLSAITREPYYKYYFVINSFY